MPNRKPDRKRLFRAALALQGLTMAQWADAAGITAEHLSLVLSGRRDSNRLFKLIDEFIDEHLISTNVLAS